ncbi:hypothetical protein PUR28_27945 [Streptomyces sp. BE308]|uniref:hypothetical protein n=1 Tax=Streptomyces sp. BE308 TaxID=3002529 RepID=UPI002E7AAC51|nr:hypothetical protein [Streptomyces sp. BE308]MEE1794560.1 hypothetical protein [Streptomyces sp. BE308]
MIDSSYIMAKVRVRRGVPGFVAIRVLDSVMTIRRWGVIAAPNSVKAAVLAAGVAAAVLPLSGLSPAAHTDRMTVQALADPPPPSSYHDRFEWGQPVVPGANEDEVRQSMCVPDDESCLDNMVQSADEG